MVGVAEGGGPGARVEEVEDVEAVAGLDPAAERPVGVGAEGDQVDETAPLPSPPPLIGIACPNCGENLASRPMGQCPCPHCGRTIHVRARQGIFRSGLVGERDVDAVDFLESVERFGVREADCRRRLQEQDGRELPQILWEVCEARLEELPAAGRAQLLEEMALYRKFQGEEYVFLRRRAAASLLRRFQEEGVCRVRIGARGGGCCAACAPQEGRELAVGEALDEAPLPSAACSRPDGMCRCTYLPALQGAAGRRSPSPAGNGARPPAVGADRN